MFHSLIERHQRYIVLKIHHYLAVFYDHWLKMGCWGRVCFICTCLILVVIVIVIVIGFLSWFVLFEDPTTRMKNTPPTQKEVDSLRLDMNKQFIHMKFGYFVILSTYFMIGQIYLKRISNTLCLVRQISGPSFILCLNSYVMLCMLLKLNQSAIKVEQKKL